MDQERERNVHVHKAITDGKEKKKSKLEKAVGIFLAEDVDKVGESILDDFIKPRIVDFGKETVRKLKEFVADSLEGCIEMIIFGKDKRPKSSSSGRVNYVSYYDGNGNKTTTSTSRSVVDTGGLKLIEIDSYGMAEEVKTQLMSFIKRYGYAYVADLYQLCNVPTAKTDFDFGWHELVDIRIIRHGGGYVLDLPKPVPLN